MGQKQQLIWDLPPIESFYLNAAIYDIERFEAKKELKSSQICLKLKRSFLYLFEIIFRSKNESRTLAALIHKPNILFLDEPTLGLDINAQRNLREFLKIYNKETGATICLTSHYMKDITSLCKK